jgi:signal peptidase I
MNKIFYFFIILFLIILSTLTYSILNETIFSEKLTSNDYIKDNQIEIQDDKIIIHVKDASLAYYAATHSMDPILNSNANGIEIIPKTEQDIKIGDIVAYQDSNDLIVHRVIEISKDNQGTYYTLKGDNNTLQDPTKVRFSQIKYKLIGVLY